MQLNQNLLSVQDCAIEVFSNDGSNHLLVFPKESARNKVYGRIQRLSPVLANTQESVSGMKADAVVESGGSLISTLLTGVNFMNYFLALNDW